MSDSQQKLMQQQSFLRQQMKSQQQNLKINHQELLQQTGGLKSKHQQHQKQPLHAQNLNVQSPEKRNDTTPMPRKGPPTPSMR